MQNSLLLFLFLYTVCEYYIRFDYKNDNPVGRKPLKYLLIEILGVILVSSAIASVWNSWELLIFVSSFGVAICGLRLLEYYWPVSKKGNDDRVVFLVRQVILLLLTLTGSWVVGSGVFSPNFDSFSILGFSPYLIMKYILLLLLVTKPINIIFKNMFPDIKPPEINRKKTSKTTLQIGGLIGSMERILIVIFLLLGEYIAIGFVFTAKSITRYKRISIQKEFAEYYLLGTLYSLLAALAVYGIVFIVL
ncbi:MAG: hypothetical protein J7L77_03285 [Clostridiales bacterium]|nr:hypothetical protein [Clostridiales bacterium]